jgi:hypothetical protein
MHTQHFALGRVSSRRLCVKSSFILVLVSSKFRLLVFTSRVLSRLASLLGFLQCLFTVFQLSFAVSLFDQSLLTIGFFQFHLTVYPWFAGAPRNTRSSHLAPRTFWKFSFIYPSWFEFYLITFVIWFCPVTFLWKFSFIYSSWFEFYLITFVIWFCPVTFLWKFSFIYSSWFEFYLITFVIWFCPVTFLWKFSFIYSSWFEFYLTPFVIWFYPDTFLPEFSVVYSPRCWVLSHLW